MQFWVLEGKTPKPADLVTWNRFFEEPTNRLLFEDIIGGARVVTVFFGFTYEGVVGIETTDRPMLFGTTILSGNYLLGQETLYATWDEAEAGHRAAVERVRGRQG